MTRVDWARIAASVRREQERMIWRPYGAPDILDLERTSFHDAAVSERWDLSEKLIVSVAVTGAFFRKAQNPHQPITPDEIRASAAEVAAGASTIHVHVRDDRGYNALSYERFAEVVRPLRAQFPQLAVDGCLVPALSGEWREMQRVLASGLLDAAPLNATATHVGDSLFAKPAAVLMEKARLVVEHGLAPEIAVYTDADVSNADRFLLRSGVVATPAVWLVLPALPGCMPMDNPRQMAEGLLRVTGTIRDVDPGAVILVCAAGRASMLLATLAASLGLHIRVGMEDTYWLWPHRDDRLESNAQALSVARAISSATGRPIASHAEYRALTGIAPRAVAR
ncbi:3-keto-5-aminohexanoate cleavage enzyme [Pseudonocardia thermophila]|uniref:3-keto-5-aminohexanoate cleavage enzyme n=1 Tax=Pseudonocardia thermophila TaxID=1848 RepID=A0A1M6UIW7_PSETH|nr:3-keto-5-aminohexanoate cleavage protein [Pseudonocardia thermophila]SHK69090.1 3-keto-5-aminohexanoate cleavage enzyme [Pseudonocardia thermophila]